jgi:hypothetical protein
MDHNAFMRFIRAIHVLFEFRWGVRSKKMLMLSTGLLPFKTQVMSLKSIIIDLSLWPNEIFSLSWVFSPHHLTATSLHLLNMLHTKWASMNLAYQKTQWTWESSEDYKTHFISPCTKDVIVDALPSHGVKPTWGFHKVKLRKVETRRHAPGFQL